MLSALGFAATFALLAGLALARHPVCGLYLYLLTFYVHPPSRWWGASLPDLRWSMLAAAVALIALVIHRRDAVRPSRPWFATAPGALLIVFVLWFWIQNFWALDQATHFSGSVQYTKYLLAFYFIYRLADTPRKLNDVLLAHVAGCLYLGWLCFTQGRDLGDRLDGVGGPGINDANSLGMVMATGIVISTVLALTQTGWRRVACVLSFPVMLNGLILTGSRGAFLGMLAGFAVVYFLRPPGRTWVFWCAAALGMVLANQLIDSKFVDRMFTIRSAIEDPAERDSSAESRVVLFHAQLQMFADYPLGSGHRGTATLSPDYIDDEWLTGAPDEQRARSSHNTFLTLLTEQGIPGAMLFVVLVMWGFARVIRLRTRQAAQAPPELLVAGAACCAGLVVVLVAGNFTDYLLAEVQIWLLALLATTFDRLDPHVARYGAPAASVASAG